MPEATAADLARVREAVLFRDRCVQAAVAKGDYLDLPVSVVQARVCFDVMEEMIRADERDRLGRAGGRG